VVSERFINQLLWRGVLRGEKSASLITEGPPPARAKKKPETLVPGPQTQ